MKDYGLAIPFKKKDIMPKPKNDTERLFRVRELYDLEVMKGVQLGRKLGAFEVRFGKLRTRVTDIVNRAVLKGNFSPTDPVVLEFRNMVRLMKGKNPHEY